MSSADLTPGDQTEAGESIRSGVQGYVLGLVLAIALTLASFWVARTHIIYGPSIPVALVALGLRAVFNVRQGAR